jgi:AAA domain
MFVKASEYRDAPPIVFWDDHKMIPRSPDGTVVLIYAAYAQMKSFIAQSLLMGFVDKTEDAVCAYATGEGAHDVGKNRLPAQVAVREMDWQQVDARFFLVQGVPLLRDEGDVTRFIEFLKMLPSVPNLICIDTLQNAAVGIDEKTSEFGSLMTDNGAIGRIKRSFPGSTVIVIHHEGKDGTKGQRGHSGTDGAVDAELKVLCDESVGVIQLYLNKLKMGGRSKRSSFWQLDTSYGGMPVPMECGREKFIERGGTEKNPAKDEDDKTSEAAKEKEGKNAKWRARARKLIDDIRERIRVKEEKEARKLRGA